MQFIPYVILLYLAAVISIGLGVVAWRRRTVEGAAAFGVLMGACTWWTLAYAMSLSSVQLSTSLFWNYLCVPPAIAIVPIAWIYFTLQYTRHQEWLTRKNTVLALIIPAVTLLLIATGDTHHLIYTRTYMVPFDHHPVLITSLGPWCYVTSVYNYGLILIGMISIIFHALHSSSVSRSQAIIIISSTFIPLLSNILYVGNVVSVLNLTPFTFPLMGLIIGFGLFRYRFLDITPIARGAVVEGMSDGLIVLDLDTRIVDINRYALTALGRSAGEVIGHPIAEVLAEWPELVAQYRGVMEASGEVSILLRETLTVFDMRISPLYSQSKLLVGRLIVFRDITERKRIEQDLHTSEDTTRILLNAITGGALLVANQGTILAANETYAHILRQPLESLIGHNILEFMPPEVRDAQLRQVGQVSRTGKIVRFSESFHNRWYDTTISPLFDANGQILRLAMFSQDITEQKQQEERLNKLAYFDHLTGLPNRFMFQDRLSQALTRMKRQNTALALLFLDLDGFKAINDRLGHAAGDHLLRELAQRLRGSVRESDTVARMGGDEFIVLLSDCRQPHEEAQITINRIQTNLAEPVVYRQESLQLNVSIGVAFAPDDGMTAEVLLRHADQAMYRAKKYGRNTYRYFTDDVQTHFAERNTLEQELQQALHHHDLQLNYQPLRNMDNDQTVGVEALLCWRHPEYGLIPPLQFISIAEETEMAVAIGTWVLETACSQVAAWHAAGHKELKLSVNMSPKQLAQHNLVETIHAALKNSGLPPSALEIELPQGLLSRDTNRALEILCQLRECGVGIAIDDIGIGHYSVDYLRQFPLNALKIDSSFIRDIADDEGSVDTVRAIIDFGHRLGLTTIAEGVETTAQFAVLQTLGCDQFQGYLFSKPLPPADCIRLLNSSLLLVG